MSDQNARREAINRLREQAEADQREAAARDRQFGIEVLVQGLTSLAVSSTLLWKARKAAKAGNYSKATYYAVLWVGQSNNSSQSLFRKLDERKSRQV